MTDTTQSLFDAGSQRMSAGDLPGAEEAFRQLIQTDPDCAEAHTNLALLLERRGAMPDEIELHYLNALNLKPWITETYLNYGAFLHNRKRLEEAEQIYRHALVQSPQSPQPWSNLGALYASMRHEAQAEQCCRMALDIDASHAGAHLNLAYVLLRQGRWDEGWQHFEARNWDKGWEVHFPFPHWQGEPLQGKRLIVIADGGYGDIIQVSRYFAQLKNVGATCIGLICQPALAPLLAQMEELDEVLTTTSTSPAEAWDYWVPALSLPHYCGTRPDNIPAPLPYLHADPARMERWAQRLAASEDLRVGLVWKGNPNFENDDQRSLPSLDLLAPLGDIPGVSFISLQKGRGEDEAMNPPTGLSLLPLGSEIQDFADTAALIAQLDLVITVDTAVAHLTGALGKPCWVLLPEYKTDWRWLTEREDTPWYPGVMRPFRQPAMGDWDSMIACVRNELERFAQQP
ncbi:MAG TPA: tetratricopeptide repeat protein [Rhodocyclaceae bacterium]|nr:tetratricopeptide repeat protein [Rhodocyclaceae bacterium]